MTAAGLLAMAALLLACAGPVVLPARVGMLVGERRLAVRPGAIDRAWRLPVRWLAGSAAIVAVLSAGMFYGAALALATAVVLAAAGVVLRDVGATRVHQRRRVELLAALRVLVAELDAGTGPNGALHAAADVAPTHERVLHAAADAAARGEDSGAILAASPDTVVTGIAWQLGHSTGMALAGVLARVAADLSAAEEHDRVVAVALSGPRSSAAVLTGLPLLGIAMGAAMGARPLPFLTSTPIGQLVCLAGVVLDVAGVLWMRRILRAAQRPA